MQIAKILSCGKPMLQLRVPFLTPNNVIANQARNLFVFKRLFPIRLPRHQQREKRMKNKNFIYQIIYDDRAKKRPQIDVILTKPVEGVGEIGQIIRKRDVNAYNELLLPKKAVYASPENLEKYKDVISTKTFSSMISPFTVRELSYFRVPVPVSPSEPWTIEPWHVKVGLRLKGVIAANDTIALPEKPISGPDLELEGKEFYATITINNFEKVNVRCVVHHKFPVNQSPFPEDYWKYPAGPVFPEFQEVLDNMKCHYAFMDKTRPQVWQEYET